MEKKKKRKKRGKVSGIRESAAPHPTMNSGTATPDRARPGWWWAG